MIGLGFRVKSGRAIAVALAETPGSMSSASAIPSPVTRAIVDLSDEREPSTRQPYHNGFGTAQEDRAIIGRLVSIVNDCARRSVGELLNRDDIAPGRCRGACLVVGSVIDPATVGNPHIRAHANEGRLFRTALADALSAHGIVSAVVVDKRLAAEASKAVGRSEVEIKQAIAVWGRALGGPWRADEKAAATAAWIALAR